MQLQSDLDERESVSYHTLCKLLIMFGMHVQYQQYVQYNTYNVL